MAQRQFGAWDRRIQRARNNVYNDDAALRILHNSLLQPPPEVENMDVDDDADVDADAILDPIVHQNEAPSDHEFDESTDSGADFADIDDDSNADDDEIESSDDEGQNDPQQRMLLLYAEFVTKYKPSRAQCKFFLNALELAYNKRITPPTSYNAIEKQIALKMKPFVGHDVKLSLYCSNATCPKKGQKLTLPPGFESTKCGGCSNEYYLNGTKGRINHLPLGEMLQGLIQNTDMGPLLASSCYDDDGNLRTQQPTYNGIDYERITRHRTMVDGIRVCALGYNIVSDESQACGNLQNIYNALIQMCDLPPGYEHVFLPGVYAIYSKTGECKPTSACFFEEMVKELKKLEDHPIAYEWKRPDKPTLLIHFILRFHLFVCDGLERNTVCGLCGPQCNFFCLQCIHNDQDVPNYHPWSDIDKRRCTSDFVETPFSPTTTGIKGPPCPFRSLNGFSEVDCTPGDNMHGPVGGIAKAENDFMMCVLPKKKTSAKINEAPLATSALRQQILDDQKLWPIPETLLRSVSASGMKHFKFKDHLTFFLTSMPFAASSLSLRLTPASDEALYKRMIGALHLMLLLCMSYESPQFTDYIFELAKEYVNTALAYHGKDWLSFNWHWLAHLAEDILRHGASMQYSTWAAELMFKTIRRLINCYHQQAARLANRRFYIMNINITNNMLRKSRWALGHRLSHSVAEKDILPTVVQRIRSVVQQEHSNATVTFYGKLIQNGFVVNTKRSHRKKPRIFSDNIVTKDRQWLEVDIIVKVQTPERTAVYCWGPRYTYRPIRRADGTTTPWTAGPFQTAVPDDVIQMHYFSATKSNQFALIPSTKIYSTAYVRCFTSANGTTVYRLIAIPIKGVV